MLPSWYASVPGSGVQHVKKVKFKVLHPGCINSWYQYRLGDEGIESSPEKKDVGVLADEKLDMS